MYPLTLVHFHFFFFFFFYPPSQVCLCVCVKCEMSGTIAETQERLDWSLIGLSFWPFTLLALCYKDPVTSPPTCLCPKEFADLRHRPVCVCVFALSIEFSLLFPANASATLVVNLLLLLKVYCQLDECLTTSTACLTCVRTTVKLQLPLRNVGLYELYETTKVTFGTLSQLALRERERERERESRHG